MLEGEIPISILRKKSRLPNFLKSPSFPVLAIPTTEEIEIEGEREKERRGGAIIEELIFHVKRHLNQFKQHPISV